MCRSIRPLRGRAAPSARAAPPATNGDVRGAARQHVREIAAARAPAAIGVAAPPPRRAPAPCAAESLA